MAQGRPKEPVVVGCGHIRVARPQHIGRTIELDDGQCAAFQFERKAPRTYPTLKMEAVRTTAWGQRKVGAKLACLVMTARDLAPPNPKVRAIMVLLLVVVVRHSVGRRCDDALLVAMLLKVWGFHPPPGRSPGLRKS